MLNYIQSFVGQYSIDWPVVVLGIAGVVGYLLHMIQKPVASVVVTVVKVATKPVVAVAKALAPAPKATMDEVKKLKESVEEIKNRIPAISKPVTELHPIMQVPVEKKEEHKPEEEKK